MYIRVTKNKRGQAYYHLVESYRKDGKVRQRVLMALGRKGDDKIDNLAQAVSKHRDVLTAASLAKEVSVADTFILGPLLVLEKLFIKLGIEDILCKIRKSHPKVQFNFVKIIFTLVASRFVKPGSKLKVYEHWQKKFYPLLLEGNLELHQIYRALDLLADHKDEIEKALFWKGRDLINLNVDIVLYDLTTLRFESTRTDLGDLRQFGYSKEMRTDCTQVVFGLLVDTDGIPLGFEVYPGNTFEGKTLSSIVEKMRKKFNVRRFIFVSDRGLFSKKNLQELEKDGGEFIVGMKLGVFRQQHDTFYDISQYRWINDDLAIFETTHERKRCVITWSRTRAKRDRALREAVLEKLRKKLAKASTGTAQFVSHKGYKKYLDFSKDPGKPILNEDAIASQAKKDGFFGVVSNVKDISATDMVMYYKELWNVEDAFGEFKSNLRARPVFHWTDHRIVGHLTMCFLAYLCEAHLTKKLRDKDIVLQSPAIDRDIIKPRPLTVVEAMRELSEVRAVPICLRGDTIWTRTDIVGNAAAILRAAGVAIPPKLIHYAKTEKCSGTHATNAS